MERSTVDLVGVEQAEEVGHDLDRGHVDRHQPELARPRSRGSLTTLVSIKYIGRFDAGLLALEIFVAPDVGHRCENFRKASPPRLVQRLFENEAMLRPGRARLLSPSAPSLTRRPGREEVS